MSDLPPTDAHAAAVEEEIEWEEEEEEEVVEVAGGGGGAVEPAAQPEAAEPTPAAPAAPAAPAPPSRAELVAHLHHLMRPFGPLEFSLATTLEPSIVPQPPRSLYPGCESGGGGGSRKRNADHSNPHEPTMSAEAFYHAVRDLKALPLVRVGRHDAAPMYEPHLIAQSIQPDAARQESTTDAAFSDIHTLGHVKAVDRFFDLAAGGSAVEYGSALHRRLFLQHEWFDPYRLLTHAPPTDAPPKPHPGDAVAEEVRYEAFRQEAGTSTVPLNVSRSLSFLSSHLALSLAELDMLHSLLTSPAQRSREGVAHAATHPPPPKDMFQTFVDLSGGEGAAAEYILWKRRVVNLRAKGWAYDLTASPAKQNWSVQWRNATAREQSKNFDVFHPPHDPTASSSAIADQLRSEQNIDTFQRMIDMQTRGVGVNLAIAANYAPDAASRVVHAASLSYRPNAHTLYPTLLFQVDTALRTLAQGGHLLLQLYETHTPFTLSVIYILFQLFDHCILQQLAGTVGYGSGQCFLLCKDFRHDRIKMRPSAFPVIASLRQMKNEMLLPLSATGDDWSRRSIVYPQEMRNNAAFVQWIQKYNSVSHAYQLHCLLSLLQPTSLQPRSLLDEDDGGDDEPSATTKALYTQPPPHHRIRLNMMMYLGLPLHEPFLGPAITRR